jgi:hypothetical protein
MNILAFRSGYEQVEGHRNAADRFVDAVTARDFVMAGRHVGKTISWFNEKMPKADWIARATIAFADAELVSIGAGDIGSTELARIPRSELPEAIDGPLEKTHRLHLYQFCRNKIWVSLGVLTVGERDVVIDRVLDLRRFKEVAAA